LEEAQQRQLEIPQNESDSSVTDHWLSPGIIVKITDKNVRDGKCYGKKGNYILLL
jgi:hypothetical protein